MRILIQFPEGLKQKALEHAKKLEGEGHEVFISSSPTYGACDLAIDEAKNIKAEKLIHFGHAEFSHVDFNVEYVDYRIDAPLGILNDSLRYLEGYVKIRLITTIQHIHQLEEMTAFYTSHGKSVLIGKPYGFAKKPGQVLGCDVGAAASVNREADAIVYIGGGIFHPLGAAYHTTKPLIAVDPFNNKILDMAEYRIAAQKRSKGRILSSIEAKNIGILVSTKNGQHNMNLAKILKSKIGSCGLSAAILVSNTIDFDSINNMLEFDAFVNTACPRIATDDNDRIRKPLLSPNELMEVLRIKEELSRNKK